MKQLIILLATLFISTFSFATTIKFVPTSGAWATASNWDLKRVPTDGDTILIAAGKTVELVGNKSFNTITLQIYGTLTITHRQSLDVTSSVYVFAGGMINNTGANSQIRVGTQVKLDKNTTVNGAKYANSSTGTSPNGFADFAPSAERTSTLPVKFIGFSVAKKGEAMAINWATAEEVNANYYLVERSNNAKDWKEIAMVMAVGNSTDVNNYSFADKATTATVYYRIKQVDNNGIFTYTGVRIFKNENTASSFTVGTTTTNKIYVSLSDVLSTEVAVTIYTVNGQVISTQNITTSTSQILINKPIVNKGIYLVSITNNKGVKMTKQILL